MCILKYMMKCLLLKVNTVPTSSVRDVNYLFAAYTKEDGTYQGKLELPSYLTKVYIYSPAFFAQTLMEANVVNGSIEATDNAGTDTRAITTTKYPYDSYLVSNKYGNEVWKTWLGTYNMYKKRGYQL